MNRDRLNDLVHWINEREAVRIKKEAGAPKPWTTDPVLQSYRFCNVRREDDKVTRWIKDNWREPYADHPNLWFAMCISRQINWPDTLADIGFPEDWKPEVVRMKMLSRAAMGEKLWTGAYMLRGNVEKGGDKPKYFTDNMTVLWKAQDKPTTRDTLQSYHERLVEYPGWGSFLAAQAVADLKHTVWLVHADDWWDWAALGPGSTKGLHLLHDRPLNKTLSQAQGLEEMLEVRERVKPLLGSHVGKLCLQDIQNCLCESVKYNRGWSRNKYNGV